MTKAKNNHAPKVGVGVILLNDRGEILLGARLVKNDHNTWAPPGGHLEHAESFEQAAVRELMEETNVRLETCEVLYTGLVNNIFSDTNRHYISIFMQAKLPADQSVHNCEPDKTKSWHWFSLDALPSPLFAPLASYLTGQGYHTQSPWPAKVA